MFAQKIPSRLHCIRAVADHPCGNNRVRNSTAQDAEGERDSRESPDAWNNREGAPVMAEMNNTGGNAIGWGASADSELVLDRPASTSYDAQRPRLLFVTDEPCLGEALARALQADLSIECKNPAETVALGLTAQADVVLVHAALRESPAVTARRREIAPSIPIIVCMLRESTETVIAHARAGMTGYVPNTVRLTQFARALRETLDGQQVVGSSQLVAALLRHIATVTSMGGGQLSPTWQLTRRERQIAALIAAGLGDKDIALQLNIGLATVKPHVHNLLRKLNVASRAHVTVALRGESLGAPH
jgi:two-component system nitrate/nitrite response regulator NarL